MRDNWLPATRMLGKIAQSSERPRSLAGFIILSEPGEALTMELVRLTTALDDVETTRQEYERVVTPGTEQGLADDVARTWKSYVAVSDRQVAMARQTDDKTAQATEEIQAQVTEIQQATTGTAREISSIGGIIGEISQVTTAIAAAIEEQGAATGEIARNVQQAERMRAEVATFVAAVRAAA